MSRDEARRLAEYLQHIHEAIVRIERYVKGLDEDGFLANVLVQDAVIRNFEVIGEASNNVCSRFPGFSAEHPDVPWALAYEMRNALAHGYFKVDLRIVWKTVRDDLPRLKAQIVPLLIAGPGKGAP